MRCPRCAAQHDALLILDEIQTGLGRLGHWWGADREGVVPDMLLAGKALGGGVMPVSALVATDAAFAPFDRDPFIHTSTFSGAPARHGGRAGRASRRSATTTWSRGRTGSGGCSTTSSAHLLHELFGDRVATLRGVGLLIGIELSVDGLAGELLLELMSAGVIANHSLNSDRVLRLTPPAVLDDREVAVPARRVRTCRPRGAGLEGGTMRSTRIGVRIRTGDVPAAFAEIADFGRFPALADGRPGGDGRRVGQ